MATTTSNQRLERRRPYSLRLRTIERRTLKLAAERRGQELAEFIRSAALDRARAEIASR